MRSSHTITLFSERPELVQRPSSFLFSILAHGGLAALIVFGAFSPPRFSHLPRQRFAVRHLDLEAPEPLRRRSAGSEIGYPGPKSAAGTPQLEGSPVARQQTQAKTGPQTLAQPDVSSPITLPEQMRVPSLLIWKAQKTVVKTIVPPPPEKPAAAEVKPSLEPPNQEINLADVRVSASDLSTQKLPIFPSNTSPVVVHGPDLPPQVPATTSASPAQPTPTAVVSLSDQRMTSGTVFLPPGNMSASTTSPGGLTPGQGKDTSQPGNGSPGSNTLGTGGGQGAGSSQAGNGNSAGNGTGNGNSAGNGGGKGSGSGGPNSGSAQGSDTGSGAGNLPGATHIRLAKDGQFGAVVVGASLEEKYPDVPSIWGGRLVYTVYLHVGLAKSWILQYSLPPSGDAAAAGSVSRIEAPWPYNIVRPDIPAGAIDADVLMIHGFVNKDGRFEALAVVFPPQFEQAQFVLDALKQWEFRPATQDGQAATVEVALIVPEETE
jgi:hypothetical protein